MTTGDVNKRQQIRTKMTTLKMASADGHEITRQPIGGEMKNK